MRKVTVFFINENHCRYGNLSCTGSFVVDCENFGGLKMSDSIHFGIIPEIDGTRDYSRFDSFEEVCRIHRCIEIRDECSNKWLNQSGHISTFACTLKRPFNGIDYCGVTLIPPDSLPELLDIIRLDAKREAAVFNLKILIEKAIENKNFLIVYGV